MNRAVFLDRDGTVSSEMGYIHEADLPRYALNLNAGEGIANLTMLGYKTVLVTNQSGVARGYYPEAQVGKVHARLAELLAGESAHLDAIYYCPHHANPEGKPDTGEDSPGMVKAQAVADLSIDCECRKPKPGMGLKAAKDLGLDLKACWMIGDKEADQGFAEALGMRFILVLSGYGPKTLEKLKAKGQAPRYVAKDLIEAAEIIQREDEA